jgi:hypothetical protein
MFHVLHDHVHRCTRILLFYSWAARQPASIGERRFDAQHQPFRDAVVRLCITIQMLLSNLPDHISASLEGSIGSLEMQ